MRKRLYTVMLKSLRTELFKSIEFYFEGGLEMAIHW